MHLTKHFERRMNQRAITRDLINFAMEHGRDCGDRVVLDRKSLDEILAGLHHDMKLAQHAQKKGGLVVVEKDGHLITTYNLNSYRRPQ